MSAQKLKIFISYSHKDEALKDQLITHLSILNRKELIDEWHDRKIIAGCDWQSEIDEQLYNSDIVVFLISPDFIASDYCFGYELNKAIELHELSKLTVIPVLVRPANWKGAPFAKIQALPKDAKAITTWSNVDEAWVSVSEGIQKTVEHILKSKELRHQGAGLRQINELIIEEADRIDRLYSDSNNSNCSGMPTGLNTLDHAIDGIHKGDLLVIASRPDNGASSLAMNIAKSIAIDSSLPVAYFSLRMPSSRLTQKLICICGDLSGFRLQRGLMEDEDWEKLVNALKKLNEAPLFIDDSEHLSLKELVAGIKKLKEKHGELALVVIDSLQSLSFDSKFQLEYYSRALKTLTRELQISIIVTLNLGRDLEKRVDKRPVIKDLSDWDSLEHDADAIIFTYRNQGEYAETNDKSVLELLIAKNSYGPLARIEIEYSPESELCNNYEK